MLTFLAFMLFVQAEEPVPVEFADEFVTCHSRAQLWEQFELAMQNSQDSWLWPTEANEVEGEGLQEEAKIQVTYKSFWANPTYSYVLSAVVPEQSFHYTALQGEHPFEGGAIIEISETDTGTLLRWSGRYLTAPGDWMERRFFRNFTRRFFGGLRSNLRDNEELCESRLTSLTSL